jgi:hypothetical protein
MNAFYKTIIMHTKNHSEDTRIKTSEEEISSLNKEDQVSTMGFVGIVAIAYAASMIAQNAIFGITGAPDYSAPLSVVLTYHSENQNALAVTSGLEVTNMVLLLLFITALHGLVLRRGGAGAVWSRFAVAAGATLSALFALTIATHIAVVVAANGATEPSSAFELMWQLHAAIFALALPALGATFIGAALATHASGLTRPWQRLLGVTGGSLAIVAGFGNLAIADGSPLVFVGVLGLAMWFVWLLITGLRLVRG